MVDWLIPGMCVDWAMPGGGVDWLRPGKLVDWIAPGPTSAAAGFSILENWEEGVDWLEPGIALSAGFSTSTNSM